MVFRNNVLTVACRLAIIMQETRNKGDAHCTHTSFILNYLFYVACECGAGSNEPLTSICYSMSIGRILYGTVPILIGRNLAIIRVKSPVNRCAACVSRSRPEVFFLCLGIMLLGYRL